MVVFKVFATSKTIFKVDIKSLILPQLLSFWCLSYNNWTRFSLLHGREESEVIARRSSFKVVLKIPQNWQENTCTGSLLQWSCSLEAYLVQVLCCEFFEIFKNIYFANVCEGLPVKSKIFTGVSFRKVLSFYYKRNRQLLYYERTSSYILLKISEFVNRVIFQNSSKLLLLKIPQQAKTCSKSTTKECFSIVIRVSF